MKAAIVLVHGFSGSPEKLSPVADVLRQQFPDCHILNPTIAGGWQEGDAIFNLEACREQFLAIVSECRRKSGKIVLFGHSTGGNLLLSFLAQELVKPDLLVLAGSPWRISGDYLRRWQAHSPVAGRMGLGMIAHLISFVNNLSDSVFQGCKAGFPVLLMHGEDDELVPSAAAFDLREHVFAGDARVLLIPDLKHHFSFNDAGTDFFLDDLQEAINDIL